MIHYMYIYETDLLLITHFSARGILPCDVFSYGCLLGDMCADCRPPSTPIIIWKSLKL